MPHTQPIGTIVRGSSAPSASPTAAGCSSVVGVARARLGRRSTGAGPYALVEVEPARRGDRRRRSGHGARGAAALDAYLATVKRFVVRTASGGERFARDHRRGRFTGRSPQADPPAGRPGGRQLRGRRAAPDRADAASSSCSSCPMRPPGFAPSSRCCAREARLLDDGALPPVHRRPRLPPELDRCVTRRPAGGLARPSLARPRGLLATAGPTPVGRSRRVAPTPGGVDLHDGAERDRRRRRRIADSRSDGQPASGTTYTVQPGDSLVVDRAGVRHHDRAAAGLERGPLPVAGDQPERDRAGLGAHRQRRPERHAAPVPGAGTGHAAARPRHRPAPAARPATAWRPDRRRPSRPSRAPAPGVALTFDMGGRMDPAVDIMNFLVANEVCATIFADRRS